MNWKQSYSKYKNIPSIFDGIKFASKRELNRYKELKILLKVGKIRELELQPRFELQPKFSKNGKTYKAIIYIADFKYKNSKDNIIVEEVKGFKTQVYLLKKKLFEYKFKNKTLKIVR